MSDITISCPHCREPFQLTKALAEPMLEAERRKLLAEGERQITTVRDQSAAATKAAVEAAIAAEQRAAESAMAERDAQVEAAKRAELAALQAKDAAERAHRDVALEVQRQVDARRAQIATDAAAEAKSEAAAQLEAVKAQLSAKDEKLKAAQQAELDALKLKAEAEDAKRAVELTVAQRLDAERTQVREAAFKERDDANRLKVAEKDKQLEDLRKEIAELQRKGGSGSQQLAGEVLELDLMDVLRQAFPHDRFDRVPKGQVGADLIQTVFSASGATCGTILWETKRTKTWQNAWLAKLREDQRAVTADIAALATETLPNDVATFGQVEGVWIMSLATIVPVAMALRHGLVNVSTARRAGALADSTKEKVFEYLTTPAFRQRVSRIVEAYGEMRTDLDKEKKALSALWNKREKQLDRVLGGVTGLYGDLQGLVGSSLPALESLDLPCLDQAVEKSRLSVVGSDTNLVRANDLV